MKPSDIKIGIPVVVTIGDNSTEVSLTLHEDGYVYLEKDDKEYPIRYKKSWVNWSNYTLVDEFEGERATHLTLIQGGRR